MGKRLIAGMAVVVVTAGVAVTSAGALTSGRTVAVRLNEFNILPAVQSAPVGKVTFVLTNKGKVAHEFVVIRTVKPAGSLLKGKEADEAGAIGEVGDLQPGQTKRLTLAMKRGHYALICNLPGHYLGGQYIDFYIH
jgi:uncharacterized cupredoxin-like copper-binding protein